MVRPQLAAVAMAMVVVVAACGGDEATTSTSTESDVMTTNAATDSTTTSAPSDTQTSDPVQFTATRSSMFDTQRTIRLEITNTSDAVIDLKSVQLVSPLYEEVPSEVRDARVAPGEMILVPLPYGDPVCGPGEGVTQVAAVIDGETGRYPLPDKLPTGFLQDRHDLECARLQIAERVDLGFGDQWEPVGDRGVRLTLRVSGNGPSEQAVVEELRGNIVFGVRAPERSPLLRIDVDQPQDSIEVELVVARCDTHALIESKTTFRYPALVRLGSEEPVLFDVEPEGETRLRLEGLIQACIDVESQRTTS